MKEGAEAKMKRLMVYSHDTSGYGNIQRMLAICERLVHSDPDLSVLIVSGSPMMQYFRIPQRLDYIKLPSLSQARPVSGFTRGQGAENQDKIKLRTDLLISALSNYRPDLFLVDKRPCGVENELEEVLNYMEGHFPETRQVLLLGDILDSPEETSDVLEMSRSHQAIRSFYDLVLMTGSPAMFEASQEYYFPAPVLEKIRFCMDLCAFAQITKHISSLLPVDQGITQGDTQGDTIEERHDAPVYALSRNRPIVHDSPLVHA